jgi:hypothetical protein
MIAMLTHIRSRIRWSHPLWMVVWLVSVPAVAAETDPEEDLLDISYIYAAVMGTGTYLLKGRRVTMFRLPLSWHQRPATPESVGWRWLFPVVLGYDDLGQVDSDIIESLLPDKLVTLSVMPGVEFVYPVNENWYVKPFIEIGGGRDFSSKETYFLTQLGVRSLTLFEIGEDWALRWGNTLRWALEHQQHSGDQESFGVLDIGLDLRRKLPWALMGERLDVGAYYIYQRFLPRMNLGKAADWEGRTRELHEFGLSIGVQNGRKILGIPVTRVRLGYKKGGKLQGWTVGTEFPF